METYLEPNLGPVSVKSMFVFGDICNKSILLFSLLNRPVCFIRVSITEEWQPPPSMLQQPTPYPLVANTNSPVTYQRERIISHLTDNVEKRSICGQYYHTCLSLHLISFGPSYEYPIEFKKTNKCQLLLSLPRSLFVSIKNSTNTSYC